MASKCISIESVEEPNNCLLPLSRSSQDDVSSVSVKIEKTETFLLDEEKYKPETPRDTQHNESLGCSLDQISLYNVIKVESEIDSSSTTIQTNSRKKNGFLITKRKHCGTKRTKKKAKRLINPSGDGKIKKKLKSINNKVTEPCTENVTSEDMPSQINDTPTSVKPQREDKSVDMPILNSEPDICETPILIEPKREVVTGSTGVELIPIKQCDVDISLDISRSSPSRQGGSPDDNKNSQDILGKIESHKSNIAASSGEQMCVGARQLRPRAGADAFGGKDIHKENRKMQKTLGNKFGIQCNGGQYRSNGGQYRSNGGQYRSNGGQYLSNGGQNQSSGWQNQNSRWQNQNLGNGWQNSRDWHYEGGQIHAVHKQWSLDYHWQYSHGDWQGVRTNMSYQARNLQNKSVPQQEVPSVQQKCTTTGMQDKGIKAKVSMISDKKDDPIDNEIKVEETQLLKEEVSKIQVCNVDEDSDHRQVGAQHMSEKTADGISERSGQTVHCISTSIHPHSSSRSQGENVKEEYDDIICTFIGVSVNTGDNTAVCSLEETPVKVENSLCGNRQDGDSGEYPVKSKGKCNIINESAAFHSEGKELNSDDQELEVIWENVKISSNSVFPLIDLS